MDRATRRESLLTNRIPWDVREIALSKDRKELAFTTNENGFSRLYLMDAATFAYRPASSLPAGIIGGLKFHPSGRFLAMTVTTPQMPEDVHVLDCSTLSAVRWTQGRGCGAPPETFVMPELVRYPSFDSVGGSPRLIPCLVYKPVKRTGPHPVLISIHGGPESQFWPSFRPEIQFFLDAFGIAVVAPNVRGSGGYGKSWLSLDNGYKREDAVRDIGRLLDWIARQPDLDSARIAVMGGSYGGYMALSSLEHFGNRLRAGIDHYGISNFITFLEHTAPYRRDLRRVEYGDERDSAMRAFLLTISPVTRARRITKPLLILQGANDARVPLAESRQIADTLRSAGGTVWFIVAGDEGHGFRRKSNRDYLECATALFLDRFLLGDAFR
jgi:dipeptidyl aminopeptidase/acylaminoacyl peptidase